MERIDEAVSEFANKKPDAFCVMEDGKSFTYKEFNGHIDNLANNFFSHLKNSKIAIMCKTRHLHLLSLFSIYRSDNVAVPLNPNSSSEEMEKTFKRFKINKIIIQDSCITPEIKKVIDRMNYVLVSHSAEDYSYHDSVNNMMTVASSDVLDFPRELRLILQTSGTTGDPKGVMLSDSNIISNAKDIVSSIGIRPEDKGLDILPLCHSFGNSILNSHLLAGSGLVFTDSMFPTKIFNAAKEATIFYGVPSTYGILARSLDSFRNGFANIRLIASAGGEMPKEILTVIKKNCPDLKFCLMYGQTEATARLSCVPPEKFEEGIGTIGYPLEHVEFKIVDKQRKELPVGIEGEIAVRGPNVMIGYIYDSEATSKKIVDGWMMTGDLGLKREDGFFQIKSRKDDLIKTGGFRIHPKEVEIDINTHKAVKESLVFPLKDNILGHTVAAAVIKENNSSIDENELVEYCRKKMIAYKVPRRIFFMNTFPKTYNGKISRRLLVEAYGC